MAATTIVTASNGWKARPMKESDYDFFMETFEDFPLGHNSYNHRRDKFSACMWNNKQYSDSIIKSGAVTVADGVQPNGVIRTYIIERPDGKAVGIRIYIFHEKDLCVIRTMVIHPSYRGNGYGKDAHGILIGLLREWEIEKVRAWIEASATFPAMTAMRTRYSNAGADLDMHTHTNEADPGGGESIKMLEVSKTALESLRTNITGWADVTYTISST
tara:strand:- start:106 stop:753 length:648 start_codon:yes stop_codon:yes gene_type:complete